MVENDFKKVMPVLLLVGVAGVGGYFLLKYLKKEEEEVVKLGFNYSKHEWTPMEPLIGEEVTLTVFAKNMTEEADCYWKIIDLNTNQTVLYGHDILLKAVLITFIYVITMPSELKLRVETGKIIGGVEEVHSVKDIVLLAKTLGISADITGLDIHI